MKTSRYLLLLLCFCSVQVGANSLSMVDQRGQTFQLHSQQGRIVLVFFGYTRCPDICPIGLSIVGRVLNFYVDQNLPVSGLFVSVDPERDSPPALEKYLSYFSPHLTGLTGSDQQISDFARFFGVNYQVKQASDGALQVDHSANLYILDQSGAVHTVIPFGLGEDHVKAVVGRMLSNPNN